MNMIREQFCELQRNSYINYYNILKYNIGTLFVTGLGVVRQVSLV